ncbi:hypothetical protein T492DRAFT_272903 [Pavlovales sp. CCMP2436]|nr:hypothetical protein T492DRAFT_272903 [Pavlovales sp. CCMP2436]
MVSWVEPELSPAAQQLCQQMATWAAAERPSAPEVAAMRMGDAPSRRAARVALWRAHAQLAAQADGESASEALEALSALQQLDGLCADAIAHVQRASGCLDLVAQRHAGLEAQSSALQRQTAVHSGHLAGTQALADALETRLSPFRALATHRRLLEAPGLPATHPDLLPALEALDRAIAGVAGSASTARDSASLLVELRTAQASGLRAIAAHIASALNSAASSALSALRDWYAFLNYDLLVYRWGSRRWVVDIQMKMRSPSAWA